MMTQIPLSCFSNCARFTCHDPTLGQLPPQMSSNFLHCIFSNMAQLGMCLIDGKLYAASVQHSICQFSLICFQSFEVHCLHSSFWCRDFDVNTIRLCSFVIQIWSLSPCSNHPSFCSFDTLNRFLVDATLPEAFPARLPHHIDRISLQRYHQPLILQQEFHFQP